METKRRAIRPIERQPMIDWLRGLLNSGEVPGLAWTKGKEGKEFHIKWCHGSRQGWNISDADLFERWARHTGRYVDGDEKNPKKWKANFRCALNSLKKDLEEIVQKSKVKGPNPCRYYRIKDSGKIVKPSRKYKRNAKNRLHTVAEIPDVSSTDVAQESHKRQTTQEGSQKEVQQSFYNKISSTSTSIKPSLPFFEKISPGLGKIEFGKTHLLKNHHSGFKVELGPVKPRPLTPILPPYHININRSTTSMSLQDIVYPETPDGSDASPSSQVLEEEDVKLDIYEVWIEDQEMPVFTSIIDQPTVVEYLPIDTSVLNEADMNGPLTPP